MILYGFPYIIILIEFRERADEDGVYVLSRSSEKWGISERRVQRLCEDRPHTWHLQKSVICGLYQMAADKPVDKRQNKERRREIDNMSKVLLVEDNTSAVKKIVRYIDNISADLEVHSVSEAGEALQYAKANDVSLFILDIQLEDYKGTSLAKQLRELPEYKYTPIIFETALAGEELSAYRDVKCYSFLVKPFGEEEFVTAFRDALGLSKQMSQQAKTIQIEQKQFILEYVTQDIAYIEAFGKKLVIHTSSRLSGIKEDTISGYTLSGLLALLDDPAFVQCHKSYVVNKSHIEKIDKSERKIFLKGFTDTIPIGNKYQAELWG